MGFLIGLLTFVLVLDCIFLILLVLIQLPKKEAGAGVAFGGAATDALFGAGSGTVLTKVTKYAAGTFFVLAIGLAMIQSKLSTRSGSDFQRALDAAAASSAPTATAPSSTTPAAAPAAAPSTTNPLMSVPAPAATTTTGAPAPSTTTSAPQAEEPAAKK